MTASTKKNVVYNFGMILYYNKLSINFMQLLLFFFLYNTIYLSRIVERVTHIKDAPDDFYKIY